MFLNGWAAFAAGVACLPGLPVLPDPLWPALVGLVLAALSLRYANALIPACLLLGLAWGCWKAGRYLDDRLEESAAGIYGPLEVTIAGLPEPVAHERVRLRVQPLREPGRKRVWPEGRFWDLNAPVRDYRPGDVWQLTVKLQPPRGLVSPGAFDAEEWWMSESVTATGMVKEARLLRQGGWQIDTLRGAVRERFRPLVADMPQAAVVLALVTGDRALMTDGQSALYREAGISHLMAISGPHVLLFAWTMVWLMRGLVGCNPGRWRRMPFHRWQWPMLLVSATAYGLLAGASLPTLRTLVMLAICALSAMAGKIPDRWAVLSRALALVLLWEPLSVHAAGFWLSFGAVAVLMVFSGNGAQGWKGFTRMQVVLFLGLMPLSLLFFGQISPVSPLANLVAVPLVGWVIVPLGLSGLVAGALWDHAGMACWFWASCLLAWLDAGLAWLLSGPLKLCFWQPSPWALGVLSLAVAILLSPRRLIPRESALFLLLPVLVPGSPLPQGGLRLSVLDVGQGLSVLIQTRGYSLLYDSGPSPMAAESVILPYMAREGIDRIDTFILSHNDLDHTGGADNLLRRRKIGELMYSAPPEGYQPADGTRQGLCHAGDAWSRDGTAFRILSPVSGMPDAADNNRSCVLQVDGRGFSVLLTGDIEKEAEAALVAGGLSGPVDVLILPHHGSKTSSTDSFIRALRPRRGVISAGYRNRFGHPHRDVVRRYREAGTLLDSTVEGGTLVYEWRPGRSLTLHQERERRHYWRIPP